MVHVAWMDLFITCRDLDKDGMVEPKDLPKLCKSLGETWSYEVVMGAFREAKPANPSQVSAEEFLSVRAICMNIR